MEIAHIAELLAPFSGDEALTPALLEEVCGFIWICCCGGTRR